MLLAKARRLTLALEVFGVIWLFTSCLYFSVQNAVKRQLLSNYINLVKDKRNQTVIDS